jgi:hypothetical protein
MDAETVWSASAASRGEGPLSAVQGKLRALDEPARLRAQRAPPPPRSGEREFLTFHNKARAKFA